MISRRLIRIKVLQVLYAYSKKTEGYSSQLAEKELFHSIQKFYDLYHLLLLLLLEMVEMEQNRIEMRRNKKIQSADDMFPSTRLIDNQIVNRLVATNNLFEYKDERKLNWKIHEDFTKALYQDFITSQLYQDYIQNDNDSYQDDKDFIKAFYSSFLEENERFIEFLEEDNIYWNDDSGFATLMVLNTIDKMKANGQPKKLLPLFKNEEDEEFGKKLIRKTIVSSEENKKIIGNYTKNWDADRIAHIDMLILQLALTELVEFSSIPVKVSLNEFIEISKYYSTERSKTFINGVLDKIVKEYTAENKLKKTGRGLIG